jgi:hypothetical protein
VTLGSTDSESALKTAEGVEVLIAAAEYYLVHIDAAVIAEPDGQV